MYPPTFERSLKCEGKETGEQGLRAIDTPSRFRTAETPPLPRRRLAPARPAEQQLDERIVVAGIAMDDNDSLSPDHRNARFLLGRQRRDQQRMVEPRGLALLQNPLGATQE